ncbi:MmyB family transcriptional regulator [Streptomyces sp. NPDC004596]|uniref:MmyB family transcriptional regulator n=1 Tax=Streptomyces sp. DSM 118148 TaxID=3448667 RepID=UPI00403FE5AA
MAHQAGGQWPAPRPVPEGCEVPAYLQDYAALVEAVPFPSLVVDHRWNVMLANGAYGTLFRGVRPHPTAMPGDNFLRFVLFHPDAAGVLGEHEQGWCLPMLAHLKDALDHSGHDHELQSIRRDLGQDPLMEAAYRQGLPHWIRAVGEAATRIDGAVRLLHHPDPRRGTTECRIVEETPRTLAEIGCTRLTMVLRDSRRPAGAGRRQRRTRGAGAHLTVVPAPQD